jgi:hypothetical protein
MKNTTLHLTETTTCHSEFLADPIVSECLPGPRLRIEICLPIVHQGRVRPQSAWESFLTEAVAPTFPNGFSVFPGLHLLPLGPGRLLRREVQTIVAQVTESCETREAIAALLAVWQQNSGSAPVSVMIQTVRTHI